MDGEHTRAMSVRALTNVDVAIFEEKDFFNALNRNMVKLTQQQKFDYLRGLQLFRRTDDSVVQNVANGG